MDDVTVIQRLLLVTVLVGLMGFERERHGHAAGFRTHILVGVGSCLIMLTGLHLWEGLAGHVAIDPTRMAAQVVSGIGFLGAGTIIRARASVRGLTTAASLWAAGGIGLAIGAGFLVGGLATTAVVLIALWILSPVERVMRGAVYHTLVVEGGTSAEAIAKIRGVLTEYEAEIRDVDVRVVQPGGAPSRVEILVKLLDPQQGDEILDDLRGLSGVTQARWT